MSTLASGVALPAHRPLTPIQEFTAVVDAVKQEFPSIKNATVQVGDLSENIYAITRATLGGKNFAGKITFNNFFASDRVKVEASARNDVSLGFHPDLGHCTGVQFIAYHEAAHLVDAVEGTSAHNALSNLFGDGTKLRGILSGYSFYPKSNPWAPGLINPPEALAEAFAAVHCSGGNWAEIELNHMLTTRGNK